MTILFEINGTTYESSGSGSARELEDRLRIAASGQEIYLDVRADDGRSKALHILPGALGTYAVWEAPEHAGSQG